MVATVGTVSTAIPNASGLETSSGGWSLHKHAVTLAKSGSSIPCWTIPNSLVGEGGLTGWLSHPISWFKGLEPAPSPELLLWGLHLGPLDKGGICLAVTMGLEGCNTFSQPGNLSGGLFSAAGSMVMSMVASITGALAGVGWALWGVTSLGGLMGVSSGRAMPLNTSTLEKER